MQATRARLAMLPNAAPSGCTKPAPLATSSSASVHLLVLGHLGVQALPLSLLLGQLLAQRLGLLG